MKKAVAHEGILDRYVGISAKNRGLHAPEGIKAVPYPLKYTI